MLSSINVLVKLKRLSTIWAEVTLRIGNRSRVALQAAPVLCSAVILPVLRHLPHDSAFVKATLIGLALACNIGGMLTPIASPQNAVALGYLSNTLPAQSIAFYEWIAVCAVHERLVAIRKGGVIYPVAKLCTWSAQWRSIAGVLSKVSGRQISSLEGTAV